MTREKLGDSYDIVKRFFRDTLSNIAPLQSDPYFLEPALEWRDYEQATGIILRSDRCTRRPIGVLLDPHTGICVRDRIRRGRAHVTMQRIANVLRDPSVAYCLVFDQSLKRNRVQREVQLRAKLRNLRRRRVRAFYYDSHAPFLFATRSKRKLDRLKQALRRAGIPQRRFFPREAA
jgi:hypothetical protein